MESTDQKQNLSPSEGNRNAEQQPTDVYSCDVCNTSDICTESELAAHKKIHHSKSKMGTVSLQCAYCKECCKSRNDLENHMKTHHVGCGKGKYKCNICDEIFSSSIILADHKLRHCKILSGNTCTLCKTVLVNEQAFYSHHVEHNNGKVNSHGTLPANCIICCQTLQTEVELHLHSKFHLKYLNQRVFVCRSCKKIYDSLTGKTLKQSADNCSEALPFATCNTCMLIKENGTSIYQQKADIGSNLKKFVCVQCPKSFDTEEEIQNHTSMHILNESSTLECHLCKQMFPSATKLQTHLIEHNFYGINQFSCYVCSSVFTAASGLQNHIIGHGLKSRPYECTLCQMKFFFRAELDNHLFVHENSVPYISVPRNGNSSTENERQTCIISDHTSKRPLKISGKQNGNQLETSNVKDNTGSKLETMEKVKEEQ